MKVVIIGSGAWGTALSGLTVEAGSDTTLVARNSRAFTSLREDRRHPVSLPGYRLPERVHVVQDAISALLEEPDIVIVAVPSSAIDDVAGVIRDSRYSGPLITATKGIDPERLKTPAERMEAIVGGSERLGVLSGPNLAGEVAAGRPAAAVVAAEDAGIAQAGGAALMSPRYRIYTANDVVGVEIAGAFKNVIAIGAGIADGMGAGYNAKAAYMTRGIAEMVQLGIACGANPMTFAGLAGIGDLMATCNSEQSRNHTVGRGLAKGKSLTDVLADMREVAEGVPTTRAVLSLARNHGIELPIAAQLARIMFDGVSPEMAIADLMSRDATTELGYLEDH